MLLLILHLLNFYILVKRVRFF